MHVRDFVRRPGARATGALAAAAVVWFGFELTASSATSASPLPPVAPADRTDKPVLTFSTLGDSRQDPSTFDPTTAPLSAQDKIWLQNTKAISRIFREISEQKSNLLVFNGDMIMGYGSATVPPNNTTVDGIVNSDLMNFYRQYGFWRGLAANLMENGTYIVPVPGNHETEWKAGGKIALVENENAWRNNMGDLVLDDDRFKLLFGEAPTDEATGDNRAAADGLTTDQSKLSYSFDIHGTHFAIINTDPVGADSHAPTNWLAQDLADAQTRGNTHFFVFGHKPAFTYYFGATTQLPTKPSGLDVDVAARDAFWAVIEQYGATYFCGHEHIFDMSQPTVASGGKAVQVMVGSGGSPFEAVPSDVTINPATDRAYAWCTVSIFKDGVVKLVGYGFDDHFGATKTLMKVTLK